MVPVIAVPVSIVVSRCRINHRPRVTVTVRIRVITPAVAVSIPAVSIPASISSVVRITPAVEAYAERKPESDSHGYPRVSPRRCGER